MPSPRLVRTAPTSLPERTDDELMVLAQAGVRDAFAVLVERHAERLVHVCSRFLCDSSAGAELAQDTWVAVWAQRMHYRAEGKFIVWLITAARNRCRNHVRRHSVVRRHEQEATPEAVEAPSPDQIDRLLVEERRRGVGEALRRLPGPMREALLLRFGEELGYGEMAEVLGVGPSTLRSRVHHGLRMLRTLLEKNR